MRLVAVLVPVNGFAPLTRLGGSTRNRRSHLPVEAKHPRTRGYIVPSKADIVNLNHAHKPRNRVSQVAVIGQLGYASNPKQSNVHIHSFGELCGRTTLRC
jgi:hypothetical protein